MSEISRFDRRTFLSATLLGAGAAILGPALTACSEAQPAPQELQELPDPVTSDTTSETPVAKAEGEFAAEPSWRQNFAEMPDGPVDPNVWNFEDRSEVPGYNDEAQGYSSHSDFVRIEAGALVIQAKKQPFTYPDGTAYEYTSGRIDTKGTPSGLSFTYGKVEATMRMPAGAGTWPAFWALSANQPHTSKLQPTDEDWARPGFYAHDGEVDFMEWYGHTPNMVEGTVHTYQTAKDENNDGERDADALAVINEGHAGVPDASSAFHKYGVEMTPSRITWLLDDKPYFSFEKAADTTETWPFTPDNQLHIILNLAMGGEGGGPIDDSQADKWKLLVKDIAYYDYQEAK